MLVHAGTLAAARKLLESEKPDAILLDLNLPDGDGITFCREIRETSQLPILMLTARDMERGSCFTAVLLNDAAKYV